MYLIEFLNSQAYADPPATGWMADMIEAATLQLQQQTAASTPPHPNPQM